MNESCNYEIAVSAAIQFKHWNEETSDHVASCAHCSEIVRIAEWTRSLSTNIDRRPLPDPDLLWIRASVFNVQAKRRRALRLFVVLQVACTTLLIGLAAMLVLDRGGFSRFSSEFLKWMSFLGDLGPLTANLFSKISISAVAIFVLVALTLLIRATLFEEQQHK